MVDINLRRSQQESGRQARPQDTYAADEMPTSEAPIARPTRSGSSSKGSWIVLLTIVVIVVVLGFLFRDKLFDKSVNSGIAAANYQAVFLTNGQVYFGKLDDVGKDYIKLNNIYYLQVTPVLQTRTPEDPTQAPVQEEQQQLSLVKLGNELHGPVDEMFINQEHVLFIEDLKEDGRVVQAIKDYEAGQQ